MDIAIPVVFPAYPIAVDLPFVDLDSDRDTDVHMTRLGHAGIILINGTGGLTKYYEYGRYDAAQVGIVLRRPIPNAVIHRSGRPTRRSIAALAHDVSWKAGRSTPLYGVYIEAVPGSFQKMWDYAKGRDAQDSDSGREAYGIWTNNCMHFVRDVLEAGGVGLQGWNIAPRPVKNMFWMRRFHPDFDYDPRRRLLEIQDVELP